MSFSKYCYFTIFPKENAGFDAEVMSCIKSIQETASSEDLYPFKLSVFINAYSNDDFNVKHQFVSEVLSSNYGSRCPTFSILAQSPENHFKVSMEAVFIKTDFLTFNIYKNIPYVVIVENNCKSIWASGVGEKEKLIPMEDGINASFELMHQILIKENLSFNNILRQWNYVPEICLPAKINMVSTQNYQIFNEIRHSFYSRYITDKGFPAATGIGQRYGNFFLDFYALAESESCAIEKIESPVQINPYQYGQEILVGEPLNNKKKHSPEFERAKMVISGNQIRVFVSGTASINGEKTIDEGNVEMQTFTTIKNIEALISIENLKKYYPLLLVEELDYCCIRAYVRDKQDLSKVASIIREKYKNIPSIIVQAEICRPDLLVEIETELFTDF